MDAFGVRRSVRAFPRSDQIIHLEGVPPYVCQLTSCNRVGKVAEGGRDLACQGITFVAPDSAARLLNTSHNITEVGQLPLLILASWVPPFKETLNWLQFTYTEDRTGWGLTWCLRPCS